jgi:DNA-binding transcriptional LysR family regulator
MRQFGREALIDNLAKGNIDWAISSRPPKRKNLDYDKIGTFKIAFCCSEELFKRFKNPVDILINIPFFESSWDKGFNKFVHSYLRKKSIYPKEKVRSDHFDFVKKLCQRGRCVMFLAQNRLTDYTGLKMFTLDDDLEINLYALWRKADEGLISIRTLKQLIYSNFTQVPSRYEDAQYQVEVSEVDKDLLKF